MKKLSVLSLICLLACPWAFAFNRLSLDEHWRFQLGDDSAWASPSFDDSSWRTLDLPHDWSIEGQFDRSAPAGNDGAYLPTGVAWYRKTMNFKVLAKSSVQKKLYFSGDLLYSVTYHEKEGCPGG